MDLSFQFSLDIIRFTSVLEEEKKISYGETAI